MTTVTIANFPTEQQANELKRWRIIQDLLRLGDLPAPDITLNEDDEIDMDWWGEADLTITKSCTFAWAVMGGKHGTDLEEFKKALLEHKFKPNSYKELQTENEQLRERHDKLWEMDSKIISEFKRGYTATGVESWPCPGCRYHNGQLLEQCGLHKQIATAKQTIDKLEKLRRIGAMMANMCFNGKYRDDMPQSYKTTMTELVREWDKAIVAANTEAKGQVDE